MGDPIDRLESLFDDPQSACPPSSTAAAAAGSVGGSPESPQSHYRLRMFPPTGRSTDLPTIYTNVDDAIAKAHSIIDSPQMIAKPHRRPREIVVFDVWTGEVMRPRVRRDDPDPFE